MCDLQEPQAVALKLQPVEGLCAKVAPESLLAQGAWECPLVLVGVEPMLHALPPAGYSFLTGQ